MLRRKNAGTYLRLRRDSSARFWIGCGALREEQLDIAGDRIATEFHSSRVLLREWREFCQWLFPHASKSRGLVDRKGQS